LQSSVYDIVAQMLSNQNVLETKFQDLNSRVMTLQVNIINNNREQNTTSSLF